MPDKRSWDEDLIVIWSWWVWGLGGVMGSTVGIVGPQCISPLLEPVGDGSVVFEGVVKVSSYPHFDQPVVNIRKTSFVLIGLKPLISLEKSSFETS